MKLYLMQHGKAMSKEEDSKRPLTEEGTQEVTAIADLLARAGIQLDQIRHSGKRRAEQTAEIVGDRLHTQVVAITGIGPTDDVRPLAETAHAEHHDVLYVGHLPFMAQLAGYLLCGSATEDCVQFQNGGVVCLQNENEKWSLNWMIVPELLTH